VSRWQNHASVASQSTGVRGDVGRLSRPGRLKPPIPSVARDLFALLVSSRLNCHPKGAKGAKYFTAGSAKFGEPVPNVGSSSDVSALAGEWNGSYQADDGSRTGSIELRLKSGADTAIGDVLMVPMDYQRPREQPYNRQAGVVPDVPSPTTLSHYSLHSLRTSPGRHGHRAAGPVPGSGLWLSGGYGISRTSERKPAQRTL
jgi:hypothetical protein